MNRTTTHLAALLLAAMFQTAGAADLDTRLVGKWTGLREQDTQCTFLSWVTEFKSDGRFSITFYADPARRSEIQQENGSWQAADGKNTLRTDGVATAEVYEYRFVDDNTVHYVNTVRDPAADCQADYEFTERRAGE